MKIYTMKYEAVIFVNASQIKPDIESITKYAELFKGKQFIPNVFQEITPPFPPQPRLRLSSSNNKYAINFGMNRIAIEKNLTNMDSDELGLYSCFCSEVNEIYERINKEFSRRPVRVAAIAHYIIDGISEQKLKDLYPKFLVPFSVHIGNASPEWNARSVSRIEKKWGKFSEPLNVVTQVNRVCGEYQSQINVRKIDGIQVVLDVNTLPEKDDERFDKKIVKDFYGNVSELIGCVHDDIMVRINE